MTHNPMPSFTLHYAISRRTPPSERVLKSILNMQLEANERITWQNERLSLTPERPSMRPSLGFSFGRFAPAVTVPFPDTRDGARPIVDGCVTGSTNVRQSIWNAHLVTSFLKLMSARNPELLFELRDDGGFVLPGAVWLKAGKPELNRAWLDEQRGRALSATGEIDAAIPFLWAEHQALEGNFFRDGDAPDLLDDSEVADLNVPWERLQSTRVGELADAAIASACSADARVTA
jgi:hypothetical protein